MEEQTIARSPPPDTKQKQKKTYSQKREKARASVPKKLKPRVFSLSGDGKRRFL